MSNLGKEAAQSYTQFVDLGDIDSSMSVLPIGISERPGSPYRLSMMKLWAEGKLHPAPITREAVEKFAESRIVLSE